MISSKFSNRKEGPERLNELSKVTIKLVAKWGLEPTSPGNHLSVAVLHQPVTASGHHHPVSHSLPRLFLKGTLMN